MSGVLVERRFRALGSECRIVADTHPDAVEAAETRVHDLERRWSRFLPDSEISRLNRAAGRLVLVEPDTFELLSLAQLARDWTHGRYNPLGLEQLRALGYDRPFDNGVGPGQPSTRASWPLTVEPIELFPDTTAVRLPAGSGFDPGGIAKGHIADLVAHDLEAIGAACAMVELGGDVRVLGEPWYGDRWRIDLAAPQLPGATCGSITVDGGGVATSSVIRRRWSGPNGAARHHVVDPATGRSSTTDLLTATIAAADLGWAEAAATSVLVTGATGAVDEMHRLGVHGVAIDTKGRVHASTDQERPLAWS